MSAESATNNLAEVMEAPRYTCALGGAYGSVLATFGNIPILHAGAGCGMANAHGMTFAAGNNTGGALGTTNTPCSGLVEEHVIFGGEDKLRDLIQSTSELMKADLYTVISGCVPALIGDDVAAVVREFQDQIPIIHVNTSGFAGTAYNGYEHYLQAVIGQLLKGPLPKQEKLVNIFGIVPNQHVFWKGDLLAIKDLLEKIGVEVNLILTEFDGIGALRKIPAAALNLVLNPWVGVKIAQELEEKFGTPYEHFSYLPVGPKESSRLLRIVGQRLGIDSDLVEKVIAREERKAYRYTEYMSEPFMISSPHAFYAVVADSRTAVEFTKYATNELGWLPELVIVTDNPPEEFHDHIRRLLTENLEGVLVPKVIFQTDSYIIRETLRQYTLQVILASSLEKYLSEEFEAHYLSIAYPAYDKVIVQRSYGGYSGGLNFMEDLSFGFGGPL